MFADERQNYILKYLNEIGKVSVKELAELYSVTTTTIRNDLKQLEARDLIIKTYGGALSKTDTHFELDSDTRQGINEIEKLAIGRVAASLIEDNQTVLLDTGTTTYHIAKHIQSKQGVTVVTNDFEIARFLEVSPQIQVFLLGGFVKTGYHCTYHNQYAAALAELNIDVAFMGANGVTTEGAFVADITLSQTKRLMVERSERVVVCCDHEKLNRKALSRFAPAQGIDAIVTDALPSNASDYEDLAIELLLAQ